MSVKNAVQEQLKFRTECSPPTEEYGNSHQLNSTKHKPLYFSEELQAWVINRYSDVEFVLSNENLFSPKAPSSEELDPNLETLEQKIARKQNPARSSELFKAINQKQIHRFSRAFIGRCSELYDIEFIDTFTSYFVEESVSMFSLPPMSEHGINSDSAPLSFAHVICTQVLAKALWFLSYNPDIWQNLRRTPSYIPAFFDELMRLHAPQQGLLRYTREDIVLYSEVIPPKQRLVALSSAANRDPSQFMCANDFLLTRKPRAPTQDLWRSYKDSSVIDFCSKLSFSLLEALVYSYKSISPGESGALQTKSSFLAENITHLPIKLTA